MLTESATPTETKQPARQKIRLGDLLVEQKVISSADLDIALTAQKKSGRRLGRIIVESGLAGENDIAQALARQLAIPFVDLRKFSPDASILQLLPETQARRFRAMPLARRDGSIFVGMADPTDLFAYDEVARLFQEGIQLAVVAEGDLLAAIDRLYRRTDDIHGLTEELARDMGESEASIIGLEALGEGQADAPVVRLLQTVFEDALQVGASDVHIEPQEKHLAIRFRIDGMLHPQTQADLKIAPALALRLKIVSGLDISEKRLPQDGRFAVKVRGRTVDVRLSTMPTQYGESVVMRLLSQGDTPLTLDTLGMPPAMLERFRAILHRPNGLVLVTGPTGSGKTTTLYAALGELNEPGTKIITVEDPVEYRLAGVNQVQANEKIDLSFSRVLRAILRQDPDVILVGEMRDPDTAQIALRAAMTGHLVLSTLHTNDAASTPVRLLDMGVPAFMVATSVQGVLAQRLVRKVCGNCKAPHSITPQERVWLGRAHADDQTEAAYVAGQGCDRCHGTGYAGRRAIHELLEINTVLAESLARNSPAEFVAAARSSMAGHGLRDQAIALARTGVTSLAEAMRASAQDETS
ncbi:GspE/PulE family protein [Thiobacillus denitrificans]|uniref:MSHA biogenesis protein MshE n=1 Tax=Thiobacillus denitrificans TaxID=36861 RepID=A0A119CU77_THIDE|nr:GspE/PulE family protein [Thiobacillus denitrificans]KVW93346.1 MSHA biogenesis protein MshE [Thiobacillus denitrificans]